jgi:hypothetical protein
MSEITVYNEQLHWRTITYSVVGKYWPATMWEPAEYPELIIHSVIGCDEDGIDFEIQLSDDEADYLESQVWKELNNQAGDYDE